MLVAGFVGYVTRPTMEGEAAQYKLRAEAAERELAEFKAITATVADETNNSTANGLASDEMRAAAEWILNVGGMVEILAANRIVYLVSAGDKLPDSKFRIVGIHLDVPEDSHTKGRVSLPGIRQHLAAFRDALWIRCSINWYVRNADFVADLPQLQSVALYGPCSARDIEALATLPRLARLTVSEFPREGSAPLQALKGLRYLSIHEAAEDDERLTTAIAKLGVLRQVELGESGRFHLIANRLRELRPDVEVSLAPQAKGERDDDSESPAERRAPAAR